ncbi:hypothetical protein F8388_023991 [Cannabis sativa]|uniref:Auxin-responsive protein n=1 Tax=Cannabis sativa TaxID=3483 RepID=A0A7J6EWT0_CANSA|nr:hypothetical protein F8388_023991 [Cannabis sativa]
MSLILSLGYFIQTLIPSSTTTTRVVVTNNQNHKFTSSENGGVGECSILFPMALLLLLPLQVTKEKLQPKEASQPCCPKTVVELQKAEKKAFSPATIPANTALLGGPQFVSFRKNLASNSSSSKPTTESQNPDQNKKIHGAKPVETPGKGLFVKINMDGVPIGRKVDLKAYDSYNKLSSAVDELFRGLLAGDSSTAGGIQNNQDEGKAITGLLDGSGEYTTYNEGDRMLVGDVPWNMFVSTVKRPAIVNNKQKTRCELTLH